MKEHDMKPGDRFNSWTIVDPDSKRGNRRITVRCDCGVTRRVDKYQVWHGKSRCCADCERPRTQMPATELLAQREGELWHRWSQITTWESINKRKRPVRRAWVESFAKFVEDVIAEVGPQPTPEHILDHDDRLIGYDKGNVVWRTPAQAVLARDRRMREAKRAAFAAMRDSEKRKLKQPRISRLDYKKKPPLPDGERVITAETAIKKPRTEPAKVRASEEDMRAARARRRAEALLDEKRVSEWVKDPWESERRA